MQSPFDMEPAAIQPAVRLGRSDLCVHRIGLGAWPMAGLTSLGVTDENSVATIRRALELGIDHVDTAYSYGQDGRSDRVIVAALEDWSPPEGCRPVVIASKIGARLDASGVWCNDARPDAMIQQAMEIRNRLKRDTIDLMYLHAPDPKVPLSESADALRELVHRGWVRWAGVSNVTAEQLRMFHERCPVVAVQTYFNMFQQQSVDSLRSYCQDQQIALVVYWVLMKGILAGHMRRDHDLDPADRRRNYPIYQGDQWQASQDLLDRLRDVARQRQCTVAQLVVAWTLLQPGISVALVGAKRPDQIEETARSLHVSLSQEDREAISKGIEECHGRGCWSR
jgi:aryl-alcohol dehydrogenase-like predicted oxidoreductase